MLTVGIATDHGGFSLKAELMASLRVAGLCVEDDDMNVLGLGGKVIGSALAAELIETSLRARFSGAARHRRRLAKVRALDSGNTMDMDRT